MAGSSRTAGSAAGRGRALGASVLVIVVVVLLLFFGVRALYRSATTHFRADQCTVGDYTIDPDQAAVAAQMVGVTVTRALPERAAVLSLAAGLQESKLRNLAGGDRDSVGVLQQRPSQGWGTPAQIANVSYATGKFLDALVKVENWATGPLADTIQAVQISADGTAYAQHEPEAQALADALTGKTPAGISCTFDKPNAISPPATVVAELKRDLPVQAPVVSGSTITVPGAGWTTAAWFVANAQRLGISSVAYAGKRWTPSKGWRNDSSAGSTAVTATLDT
ncbi:hypothetical protein SAMN05892883_4319 [Jatrophihabitans sp. GAS493]|uniref:hypothetical protein n=1 Tax=Jatrophihabitans sp. GAS493 TaxID=1907575 RepID=UPI000BB6BDF4|nr:hypothetical protein [Jatrophihabitans sp. GAS493]SOD75114.1 hypothetical protein SAMN05892883_4319 [Jatrophihabitans sp. GAS493]